MMLVEGARHRLEGALSHFSRIICASTTSWAFQKELSVSKVNAGILTWLAELWECSPRQEALTDQGRKGLSPKPSAKLIKANEHQLPQDSSLLVCVGY